MGDHNHVVVEAVGEDNKGQFILVAEGGYPNIVRKKYRPDTEGQLPNEAKRIISKQINAAKKEEAFDTGFDSLQVPSDTAGEEYTNPLEDLKI